jgi:biotin synthase
LIDEKLTAADRMRFNAEGQICDFGVAEDRLEAAIDSGEPFRTSGCAGYDGQVACNRPFANSRPGPDMRNYPFAPTAEDVARIREQMGAMPACG